MDKALVLESVWMSIQRVRSGIDLGRIGLGDSSKFLLFVPPSLVSVKVSSGRHVSLHNTIPEKSSRERRWFGSLLGCQYTGVTCSEVGLGIELGVGLANTFKISSFCTAISRVGESHVMPSCKFPHSRYCWSLVTTPCQSSLTHFQPSCLLLLSWSWRVLGWLLAIYRQRKK
jgi:hypothetical protein